MFKVIKIGRKKRTGAWILLVVLIFSSLALADYMNIINVPILPFQAYGEGFTVKSISLAYPPQQGQPNEWIINILVNGWGQNIIGNLDSGDITYQGAETQYPLSITGKVSENDGYYLIDNSNPKNIYQYKTSYKVGEIKDYVVYKSVTEAPLCDGSPKHILEVTSGSGLFGLGGNKVVIRNCVYQENIATKADVSSLPNIIPTVEINVNTRGSNQPIELKGSGVYPFNNGLGSISWVNSPVQGGSLGVLSIGDQYVAIYPMGATTWKVAYRSDYEGGGIGQSWSDTTIDAEGQLKSLTMSIDYAGGTGCRVTDLNRLNDLASCLDNYIKNNVVSSTNTLANRLVNSNININNKFTRYSEENNQKGFWVDLGNVYTVAPELMIRIKSEWIGIVYPQGTPDILSVDAKPYPFRSGEPLTIKIGVKNVGTGTGSFIVQDFICGSLKPQSQIYPITIGKGVTETISFGMSSSYQGEESGTCSGKVCDTGSLKCDSWSADYKMEKAAQCIENNLYWYGGNLIQICKNGELVNYKSCEYGVTVDKIGNWACATKPDGNGDNGFKFGTSIIFAMVGGILATLIIGANALRKKDWVGISIGVISGGMIGYIIYIVMANLVKFMVGGVIGLFLGGATIYFFGGALVVIATVIALIIKTIKGG